MLKKFLEKFPTQTFYGVRGAFLTRFDLASLAKYRLYLHHFHRSDEDKEFHNHPWEFAVCLILKGGYQEESLTPYGHTSLRSFYPGTVNVIKADKFHRVTLLEKDSWSLLLVGPGIQQWGFKDKKAGKFTPWRDFIRNKGLSLY